MAKAKGADRKPRRRSIFWRARRVVYVFLFIGLLSVSFVWRMVASIELPEQNDVDVTTLICDATAFEPGTCTRERSVAQFASDELRIPISYAQLPKVTIDAVVAGEDRQFFKHRGIDPVGIGRALYQDIRAGGGKQGGSTITQQYIKMLYLTADRSVIRKVRETVLAMKIEKAKSKERILEEYLNLAPFGRRTGGIEAASIAYFGHGASTLSLSESAYLAARIREPYSTDDVEVERRRKSVLDAMVEEKFISAKQGTAAKAAPPTIVPAVEFDKLGSIPVELKAVGYDYLMEMVRVQAYKLLDGGENVITKGYRIYTTVNPEWQKLAYHTIYDVMNEPSNDPDGALVTLDESGAIRALVGGRSFANRETNLAVPMETGGTGRPAGSTFKPIVLAEFVQQGYSLESTYDAPPQVTFEPENDEDDDEPWIVDNFKSSDFGRISVIEATERSVNTAYAQIMRTVTPEKVSAMAQVLGLNSLEPNQSLVLGTGEVQLRDMTAAYSTFMNKGNYRAPYLIHRIEDADGNVVFDVNRDPKYAPKRVLDESVARTVSYALSRVVSDAGSGGRAQLPNTAAAGKTGTTQNSWDAWFIGYTCKVATGIWLGYPDATLPMNNIHGEETVNGSNFPAEMWNKYMRIVADNDPGCSFPRENAGKIKENGETLPRPTTTTTTPIGSTANKPNGSASQTPTTARAAQGFAGVTPVTNSR